jgi:hypothetical protein
VLPVSTLDVDDIEQDLRELASQKEGFERPEKLAGSLRVVLDLSSVLEVAGPDRTSPVARVLAFRTVLRTAVDQIMREETRAIVSIYLFLLTEEELVALNLDPGLRRAGLGERCTAIENRFLISRFRGELDIGEKPELTQTPDVPPQPLGIQLTPSQLCSADEWTNGEYSMLTT